MEVWEAQLLTMVAAVAVLLQSAETVAATLVALAVPVSLQQLPAHRYLVLVVVAAVVQLRAVPVALVVVALVLAVAAVALVLVP